MQTNLRYNHKTKNQKVPPRLVVIICLSIVWFLLFAIAKAFQ